MAKRKLDPYGSMFIVIDAENRFRKSGTEGIEKWAEENELECKFWESIGCIEMPNLQVRS